MPWILIVTLIIIGLLLLMLEVLVIPGTTIAGIIGAACIIFAIWQAYTIHGTLAGHSTVGGTLIISALSLFYVIRTKTWSKIMLKTEVKGKVNVIEKNEVKVSDTGISISRLAPSGKALINDKLFEVHSLEGFIDQDMDIVVKKIRFNKIIVKLKN